MVSLLHSPLLVFLNGFLKNYFLLRLRGMRLKRYELREPELSLDSIFYF